MSRRIVPCMALALGLLGVCLAIPTAAAPARNLLVDPDFETAMPGHAWMPTAWDTSASEMPTVFFGRDTTLTHSGRFAVSVANVSTLLPLWHNWSQTLVVDREMWNKDVVFSAWTRSNGVQGRGYILLQAYRDTSGKMARIWNVPREEAQKRLGIVIMNDPYVYLGAKREYFSDSETEWVRREVRVFVPPSTNLLIVRCGLFGTGQVLFDDASLTAEPARPAPEPPVRVNLLADPDFEGDGDDWDYSLPPYDELRCDRDTTVVHSGKASVRFMGGLTGMVKARAGVVQLIGNRALAGKRVRLTAWVKPDSLMSTAFIKIYCTTLAGDVDVTAPQQIGRTAPWTKLEMEMDTPKDTYQVWAWLLYNAPATGSVNFDEASFEVLGPAPGAPVKAKPAPRPKSKATDRR